MATWGGFSRDGRIAPNNNLDCNNNNDNNTHLSSLAYTNTDADANTNANTNTAATSTSTGTADHCLFNNLDLPDLHLADFSISSGYSFPPLPSLSDNDLLFATAGNTLSTPFHTTPNTTTSRRLPRPPLYPPFLAIPPTPTPTSTQTQTQTLTPALTHQPHHSNFGFSRPYDIPGGGHRGGPQAHAPSQNDQFRPQPPNQNNSQNYYNFTAPPFSYFATTPSTLPQPHVNNTNLWSNPSLSQAQSPLGAAGALNSDGHYLAALVNQDFSSPSLPPLTDPLSPTRSLPPLRQSKFAATQEMPPSSTRRRIAQRGGAVDLTKDEPDFDSLDSGIDPSIPSATMPATTRRRSLATADFSGRKRRPSTVTSPSSRPSKTRRKEPPIEDGQPCPFDDDDPLGIGGQNGSETIDLSNHTEVPAEHMAPKEDTRIKLGNFQCVICMDNTTALTVTHCGHLFCSECLHSSLHIDSMKRTCPVCRAKVELKDKNKKALKSYFHLELKVMTATKKGKRPVGT